MWSAPELSPDEQIQRDRQQLERALQAADQTSVLELGHGVRHDVAAVFQQLFGTLRPLVVADVNTFTAAGKDVLDSLARGGCACADPYIFDQSELKADFRYVTALEQVLSECEALVPVAVGSGTINDLTKLAAHRSGRRYMAVATAASMDGYSSYGASITRDGFKQTMACKAPAGIVADIDILVSAPADMNSSGK